MSKWIVSFIYSDPTQGQKCSVRSSLFTCINNALTSSGGIVLVHCRRTVLHWVISASKEALMYLCLYRLDRRNKQRAATRAEIVDVQLASDLILRTERKRKKVAKEWKLHVREQESRKPIFWLDT